MGRPVNPNVPEAGFVSAEQFRNTGSIAQSDFAVVADLDNSRKIVFDASAQSTGKIVTLAVGANTGNITVTLPASSGVVLTQSSDYTYTTAASDEWWGGTGVDAFVGLGANNGRPFGVITTDLTGSTNTKDLVFNSGSLTAIPNGGGGQSGGLYIATGNLVMSSGTLGGFGNQSGGISVQTGKVPVGADVGGIILATGNTDSPESGTVTLQADTVKLNINTNSTPVILKHATTSTNNWGSGNPSLVWDTDNYPLDPLSNDPYIGTTDASTNSAPLSLAIMTGSQTSVNSTNNTGDLYLRTGSITDAGGVGLPGSIYVYTGQGQSTFGGIVIAADGNFHASVAGELSLYSQTKIKVYNSPLDMNSHLINNVTDPASAQDAATKAYVDGKFVDRNARAYGSTTTISGSLATIVYATKDYDVSSSYNNSTGVYTAAVAGKYQVIASLLFAATVSLNNTVIMEIQKNNTVVSRRTVYLPAALTDGSVFISDIISCAASDTLKIQVSTNSTSPSIVSSNFDNYLSIAKVF